MKKIINPDRKLKPNNRIYDNLNYVSNVFHYSDVFSLSSFLKESELYEVNGWQGLIKYGIDCSEVREFYTKQTEGIEPEQCYAIPIMVALKVDDEFEHAYTISKLRSEQIKRLSVSQKINTSINNWSWCIFDTTDENLKVIALCDVEYNKK